MTLADTACAGSVSAKARVVKLSPKDGSALADLANAYGWLGDAQTASGARQKARRAYLAAANTVNRAVELDPQNLDYRDVWVTRRFSLAELEREEGQLDAAVRRLQAARQTVSDMVGRDPANQLWRERLAQIERKLASLTKVQKEKA